MGKNMTSEEALETALAMKQSLEQNIVVEPKAQTVKILKDSFEITKNDNQSVLIENFSKNNTKKTGK